ncbi:TPA: hypothetical protein I6199_000589 [Vibrio cholerae]|nr:hypothetical protein [Vibrio cholerae]HDZ3756525.1 hypothetical protein [Vibrio cholerae]HDZ3781863.1 hypothetical protein [Vibrio cholerae]HDZ3785751.1 hypothetical protein [Vibrio cholerae]
MKSKLALVIACVLPFSAMAEQSKMDEIMAKFEMSHVYPVDWDKTDSGFQAESIDENRQIKIKLSENSAMAKINFDSNKSDFEIFAIGNCYRIADLIPMDKSISWSDEPTDDEKTLSSVMTKQIKVGETKKATIKGWEVSFTKTSNGAHCEVVKL